MSLDGQRLDRGRHAVVPRTISFIVRQNEILLIKLSSDRAGWSGLYNGIGGHVEDGKDPLSAAHREVQEETGLTLLDQQLCGVVMVDTGGSHGIGLFVFVGETSASVVSAGPEGAPTWLPLDRVSEYELVEDLTFLIPQALEALAAKKVFFATYSYDANENLQIGLTE